MHFSALKGGEAFSETYGKQGGLVIDLGGRNVNGSLRSFFESRGMKFVCIDMEPDPSVDMVVPPGQKLPFEDGSVDLVVSTSCFEHDPCFWLTFKELTRIIKPDGYIYICMPTRGFYHGYPGDNWRFFSDAGQALAYWSGKQMSDEKVYPVKVLETFHITNDVWQDLVTVWKRVPVEEKETGILVSNEVLTTIGPCEQKVKEYGLTTVKRC